MFPVQEKLIPIGWNEFEKEKFVLICFWFLLLFDCSCLLLYLSNFRYNIDLPLIDFNNFCALLPTSSSSSSSSFPSLSLSLAHSSKTFSLLMTPLFVYFPFANSYIDMYRVALVVYKYKVTSMSIILLFHRPVEWLNLLVLLSSVILCFHMI